MRLWKYQCYQNSDKNPLKISWCNINLRWSRIDKSGFYWISLNLKIHLLKKKKTYTHSVYSKKWRKKTTYCVHTIESVDMDIAMNNILFRCCFVRNATTKIIKSPGESIIKFRKILSPWSWSFELIWNQNEMNKWEKKTLPRSNHKQDIYSVPYIDAAINLTTEPVQKIAFVLIVRTSIHYFVIIGGK